MPADPRAERDAALRAYERGDDDALDLIEAALAANPHDGGLLIAQARARAAAGAEDPAERLRAVLRTAPDWLDGHVACAQILWDQGDEIGWLVQIEHALRLLPRHAALWMRYMNLLAGSGASGRAADVARQLRGAGDAPALRLIEAHHAGMAGDLDRAEGLLGSIADDLPEKAKEAARHRLRRGDAQGAAAWLEQARAAEPWDMGVWALTELAWRACGDPRHAWLMGDGGLVATIDLTLVGADIEALAGALRPLHAARAPPLGQSARRGTQTSGNLWLRREAEIGALKAHVDAAVARFVAGLPPADPSHPLLRHRHAGLEIVTGWSIRLSASGHHISHIHSEGVVSSACYVIVPDAPPRDGWLELGRPPADLGAEVGPELDPLASVEPKPGRLVLFPSYLYHATRPFAEGERLSVAFDAAPRTGA